MLRIVVLVSGGGTNLQALIDAQHAGKIKNGKITCVISSKEGAFALERARRAGIEAKTVARKLYASAEEYDAVLLAVLQECRADLIVLAGFMSILGSSVTDRYANRIINVHPALIPSFCGKGYYGLRVHEAALSYGVKVTGATVHFVNNIPDGGAIILQKAVAIQSGDTPEILQRRVMEQAEWKILPQAVSLFCEGRIHVNGNRTEIISEEEIQ